MAFLAGLLVVFLLPFGLVAMNAVKANGEYAKTGPLALPVRISMDAIVGFWKRVDFTNKLENSFMISLSVAVLGVLLSLLNAFALGIGKIKGRIVLLVFFIFANTLPNEALAYPLYYMMKYLGFYDKQISVIIIFTIIQSAYGTYLLSSVFGTFPREILEASEVDGCNKSRILFTIIMPNTMPTLSVLFTFFFTWTWNEFFLPLIMLISSSRQTVPISLSIWQGQYNMDATMACASALLGILPCVIFFILFQRNLTRGVTLGGLK